MGVKDVKMKLRIIMKKYAVVSAIRFPQIDFKALSLHKDYPLVWELSKNFFIFESGLESWIDRES